MVHERKGDTTVLIIRGFPNDFVEIRSFHQKSGTKLLARAHAYTRMLFLYSSCNFNTNRDRHIVKFPNKK